MRTRDNKSSYNGYVDAIFDILGSRDDVFVVSCGFPADEIPESAGRNSERIIATFAAQDMVLVASGLALEGNRVFMLTPHRPLAIARSYEQIRAAVAVPNLKVVLSSVHDGDAFNSDGAPRQMTEDFALMRVVPNMAVLAPSDYRSSYGLAMSLLDHGGPAYIRLSHSPVAGHYDDDDFHPGGGRLLAEGDGVTICANGVMVEEALLAARTLSAQGINSEIIDCYSVKPLPEQMLLASVRRTGCCVVAEKHSSIGGLYGAVCECLCGSYTVPVRRVAIEDSFGQSGTPDELQEYYGLTHREIVHNVVQAWSMRRR